MQGEVEKAVVFRCRLEVLQNRDIAAYQNMELSELSRRLEGLLSQDAEAVTLTYTLELKLGDGSSETESAVSFNLPHSLESLSLDFSKLLEHQVLPDVKLKCAGRTFPAHKAVLAARSEVFAAMFRHDMVESEIGVVDVTDLDAPVLDLFLKFVYTGKVQGLTEDLVPSVYAACDKYAVHGLKKACSDRMIAGLSEGNCVRFLAVADAHGDAPFKEKVVSFICEREAILRSEAWLSFAKKHLQLANEVYESYVRWKSRTSVDSRPSSAGSACVIL